MQRCKLRYAIANDRRNDCKNTLYLMFINTVLCTENSRLYWNKHIISSQWITSKIPLFAFKTDMLLINCQKFTISAINSWPKRESHSKWYIVTALWFYEYNTKVWTKVTRSLVFVWFVNSKRATNIWGNIIIVFRSRTCNLGFKLQKKCI